MFEEESLWIKDKINKIDSPNIKTILDVGSSILEFRTIKQSFIDKNIFKTLREKNKKIYHLDKKQGIGIDIICDISKINDIKEKFDLIICTNLLEHVSNRKKTINNLKRLLKNNGYLLITVPYKYRYHRNDTLYRPSNKDLEKLFPDLKIIFSEIITINKPHDKLGKLLKIFNIKWKVSCVLFQKLYQIMKILFETEKGIKLYQNEITKVIRSNKKLKWQHQI
jgi:SAM-dependent methyltransferase